MHIGHFKACLNYYGPERYEEMRLQSRLVTRKKSREKNKDIDRCKICKNIYTNISFIEHFLEKPECKESYGEEYNQIVLTFETNKKKSFGISEKFKAKLGFKKKVVVTLKDEEMLNESLKIFKKPHLLQF